MTRKQPEHEKIMEEQLYRDIEKTTAFTEFQLGWHHFTERQMTLSRLTGRPPEEFIP